MEENIKKLKQIIEESDNIVFFGGAGVSTESGIPDFRSENGIYRAKTEYGYNPEIMLSRSFFESNKEIFFKYYKKELMIRGAQPNRAHKALAKLEAQGKLKAVITQNIDGLHQAAGSKNVLELHGTLMESYCVKCGKRFGYDYVMQTDGVTICDECGAVARPDIVLYEESLNDEVVNAAINYIRKAQTLIVGGTSLVVYPAAGFINYFRGETLVLINKSKTSFDNQADITISAPIGEVLGDIVGA